METFTQPKITGYRQLTPIETELMNEGKRLAETCGHFVEKLKTHINTDGGNADGIWPAIDKRWVSIGETNLQTGFMALIRSIAQPTTF